MAFVSWKQEYSAGQPDIDAQHRRLLDIINQLHKAMKMGGKQDAIIAVMGELVSYTRYHFTFEENMLQRESYPELEVHRVKHRAMVAQVVAFRDAAGSSASASTSLKLMSFLKDWLSRHIIETDQRYAAHLSVGAR